MKIYRNKSNEGAANAVVDLIHDTGNTDYLLNGTIYQNAPIKCVMVSAQADLASLEGYEPGTIAYTAGFGSMWQLGLDGTWTAIE